MYIFLNEHFQNGLGVIYEKTTGLKYFLRPDSNYKPSGFRNNRSNNLGTTATKAFLLDGYSYSFPIWQDVFHPYLISSEICPIEPVRPDLELFRKFLETKIRTKVAHKFGDILGYFEKHNFSSKNWLWLRFVQLLNFLANLYSNIWSHWI